MGIDVNQLSPWAQKQIAAKLAQNMRQNAQNNAQATQKKSKYHSTPTEKTTAEGKKIRFASKLEAKRYDELMLMLKAGKIRDLKLQHDFTLQEAYTTPEGERVRAIRYKADFSYEKQCEIFNEKGFTCYGTPPWELVVEDTKGVKTPEYKLKKKLFREKYGFDIREVR